MKITVMDKVLHRTILHARLKQLGLVDELSMVAQYLLACKERKELLANINKTLRNPTH